MNRKLKTIVQIGLTLVVTFAIKFYYSTASVNDLRWILAPTTFLVEIISGRNFTFESHAGYMSEDHTFLIAASCSGVNFLIISFLTLTMGKIWRERTTEWRFLPIAALVAYVTTLVANTTRIVIALATQGIETTSLDQNEIHRVEGIVVYFGFLIVLFFTGEKLTMGAVPGQAPVTTVAARSKYLLIIYYFVTLGIPLVRGSYHEPGFRQHALFVIFVPLILIITFAVATQARNRFVSRGVAPAESS